MTCEVYLRFYGDMIWIILWSSSHSKSRALVMADGETRNILHCRTSSPEMGYVEDKRSINTECVFKVANSPWIALVGKKEIQGVGC